MQRFEEAVPVKTAEGAAELAQRSRGLSQRHRTVLLLVDGQRPVSRVLATAQAAGVQPAVFDELVSLGMVEVPAVAHIELPLEAGHAGGDSSLLPASRSLLPESGWSTSAGAPADAGGADRPLQEARELLMRALRAQAPVSGSLTLMKLRRATNRDEVEALLDEVEQRLRRPHRMIVAAQTMRHVRHLLGLPGPGQR
ncbi:MAG TPA: hypothetical protein VFZ28_04400 [Burkholderiaceae bacterium]|nr:hypothetical protein [Burkholderiaceae bacterium]